MEGVQKILKKAYSSFIGKAVIVELTGKKQISGYLIDVGSEVIIIFNGEDYIYISSIHIRSLRVVSVEELDIAEPTTGPMLEQEDELALRKILTSAKGVFIEIYLTGNQSIHGYITSIMNNYFAFYSPVYKTMYISLQHLKWITPYSGSLSPYALGKEKLPVNPSQLSLARSYEIQLGKLTGQLVVFNLGQQQDSIGKIEKIENNIIQLITARGKSTYINLQHIQTVHQP
jgi:ribosome maturation factor RimP